jgi:glycosyltransferase involved in cell wall biosynthesis
VLKTGVYLKQIPNEVQTIFMLKNVFLGRVFTYLQIKFNIQIFYRYLVCKKIKKNYDVAISFTDNSYTELLTYLPNSPKILISWVHASYASYSNYSKYYTDRYKERIIKNRYNKIDKLVFVSHDSMYDFISIFGKFNDMRVIYNVLNIDSVKKHTDAFNPNLPVNINIVAIGSLLPVKGYDLLIKACDKLKKQHVDFHLTILGDGPLKDELQKMINELDLSNQIILKGFVSNPYPYLKYSDVYVMSSLSEALPTALCEAMIIGRPVIVTDCIGCKEIVEYGKYGLSQMILDKEIREKYSLLSKDRAKRFSDEKIIEDIELLLN